MSTPSRPIPVICLSAVLLAAVAACVGSHQATPLPTPSQSTSSAVAPTTVRPPAPVPTVQSPKGVLWILEMLDGHPAITNATPTLVINGSRYGGGDGCNGGSGGSDDGRLLQDWTGPYTSTSVRICRP